MRVGIVYTSTTPELIETVNTELKKQLGEDVEFLNYEDPSILAEVRDAGFVTAGAAARLVTMFMQAVQDGAEVVLNCCSSVGEVADAAVSIGKFTGIPFGLTKRCVGKQCVLVQGSGYWQHYLQRWNRQNIRLREWPGSLENR